jgi:hypothetical protein
MLMLRYASADTSKPQLSIQPAVTSLPILPSDARDRSLFYLMERFNLVTAFCL